MLSPVLVDRDSFDVLHHYVRKIILHRATVEESRNVWVLERGEDLTFGFEAIQHFRTAGAHPDNLQCDTLTELKVRALPKEHGSHAAFTQEPKDAIRSYTSSGLQLTFIPDARSCASDCVGKGIIVAVETKEGFNLPAQLGVAGAVTIEKSALLIRRKIGSLVEKALEFVPLNLMEQSNRHFNADGQRKRARTAIGVDGSRAQRRFARDA
jgi:hypothetical protein